ncbi:MAG: copper oxidase [Geobacteraceae bacterium GWC2_48_7]|nr:MAG: copper oxidase [Geobacteraceae bacterium GWC2_48_7]
MNKKQLTRRKFLTMTSLGVTGAYVGLHTGLARAMMNGGGGGGTGGGPSGTIINPPVGGNFRDPVEMIYKSLAPGVVEVDLDVRKAGVNVNGVSANLMTYNGYYPAPTIRVKKGDRLIVNLTNSLPATSANNLLGYRKNVTNLHTHGFHVSPEAPSDYVMYELEPGHAYRHEYDTSLQEAGTFNFYHPHKHGVSAEQYWAGLAGSLIVEDENELLKQYETHIMVLKDITLSGSEPAPHSTMMDYMQGKEGNLVMVNGVVNPRLNLKNGQVQRWRIVNASSARCYRLALDGHKLNLIGTDGGLLDRPYPVSEILISPGERVDLLVRGTQGASSGSYSLKALPYSRMGMASGETRTLMTVTYNGTAPTAQNLPVTINSAAQRLNPSSLPIAARRTLTLSMGQGNAFINGQDFDVSPYTIMSKTGTYEIWTIVNQSNMDHPFHQHVNPAQVLSISGGDAQYSSLYTTIPAWKDVVLVPKMGSATIIVPVKDFKGMAMFHCHILEHEDIGMMGMWHLMTGMGM